MGIFKNVFFFQGLRSLQSKFLEKFPMKNWPLDVEINRNKLIFGIGF